MLNQLRHFHGHEVEIINLNGVILFNPYHIGECLEISKSAVRMALKAMNSKQVIKLRNSDVNYFDIRNLNNAGENFITESGLYKLIFRSNKPKAEEFTDWVTDEVLPAIRTTGSYITNTSNNEASHKDITPSQSPSNIDLETLKEKNAAAKLILKELKSMNIPDELKLNLITEVYGMSSNLLTQPSSHMDDSEKVKELRQYYKDLTAIYKSKKDIKLIKDDLEEILTSDAPLKNRTLLASMIISIYCNIHIDIHFNNLR